MKTIGYYDSAFSANVVKAKLEDEGIQAVVMNENHENLFTFNSAIPSMRTHIVVADHDFEKALEILNIDNSRSGTAELACCPYCDSRELIFRFGKDKPYGKVRSALIKACLLILSTGTGKITRHYYCRKCNKFIK